MLDYNMRPFLLLLVCLMMALQLSQAAHQVLLSAGADTTELSVLLGCSAPPPKTCAAEDDCEMDHVRMCFNGKDHIIDLVHFDAEKTYDIENDGKAVKVSALQYPLYVLLDFFEKEKIPEAEFYLVIDMESNPAASMATLTSITSLLETSLRCTVHRVLYKFNPQNSDHVNQRLASDIVIVAEDGVEPVLSGTSSTFALEPSWKEKYLSGDFAGVRSEGVDMDACVAWKKSKIEWQDAADALPIHPDTRMCTYSAYEKSCDSKGKNCKKNRTLKQDKECMEEREEFNNGIRPLNDDILRRKRQAPAKILELNEFINEKCIQVPNFADYLGGLSVRHAETVAIMKERELTEGKHYLDT